MPKEASPNVIGRELFLASLIEDGRHLGSALHGVARRMEEVTFEAGEFVYRLGERSQFFFFVMEGSVTLRRPGAAGHTFGPREVFGLFDTTSKEGHAHSAEATKPSRLLRLSVEDWADLLEDNFEMAQRANFEGGARVAPSSVAARGFRRSACRGANAEGRPARRRPDSPSP